ncbi:hypothetical protein FACS1894105_09110 [Clostridia bacterium]|nr:hypothetical protein FACS1894105_09110 [Clostridia bacterium]
MFIDSKGVTQIIIERPFVFLFYNKYEQYVEFLKERGGSEAYGVEFTNTEETEINSENQREKVIELAKNELTKEYEYRIVIVYYDEIKGVFIVSFWEDNTFTKGEHIFIGDNAVTKLIMYTH